MRAKPKLSEPLIAFSTPGTTVRIRGRWAVGAAALVVGLALAVFLVGVVLDRAWIVSLVPLAR